MTALSYPLVIEANTPTLRIHGIKSSEFFISQLLRTALPIYAQDIIVNSTRTISCLKPMKVSLFFFFFIELVIRSF